MNPGATRLRPAPPFLVGGGLLLWGLQNGFLMYALFMAILLETAHRVSWRWTISDKEFNNITDLSSVVFFAVVVYIFTTEGSKGIFTILSVLPFVFFLILLTQLYSERGRIKLSALFVSLRKLDADKTPESNQEIDISLPYFMACLISASAGNQKPLWFFTACCLFISIVLWSVRPKRYRILTWVSMLGFAFLLGYAGQAGITRLQAAIEAGFMQIFDQFMWRYRDAGRTTTAIGSIGRLKLSDRIVIRIKTDEKLTRPLYLQEAAYNSYSYGVWSTAGAEFSLIDPDAGGNSWTLGNAEPDREIEISTYMVKEKGVIPLPQGTSRITGRGIIEIDQNPYGAVNMEIHEGWIRYKAGYRNNQLFNRDPDKNDLYIADSYRKDFDRLAEELGLHEKPPREIIRTVENHFAHNFFYSLTRKQRFPRGKYLADFLFKSRKGHCEFFATSTVLLLRSAGIPARYAVGYSTQEYSRLEGQYVARARHAHSWALAYVNKHWRMIDTTPSVWAPLEDEEASGFESLIDLWSWLNYKISRWQSRDNPENQESSYTLLWLLIPLVLFLAWRLYFKQRVKRSNDETGSAVPGEYPGMNSGFYRLSAALERAGFRRRAGETMYVWISRVETRLSSRHLHQALMLHYRYRFDPHGLSSQAKNRLNMLVNAALLDLQTMV
ncbi:MAG: transglutaminase family protein [Gammaproteobacteria bacterium]